MKTVVSQSLFSYWNALRRNRPAPKRFEIEPSRIANNLPDAFILERINQTNARFRLAGTRITEALGMELRGKNLFELFDAADATTMQNEIQTIAGHCGVALFNISAGNDDGMAAKFEVLILPLTHMHDSVDRFLGSITPIDQPGWLGAVPLPNRKLLSSEIIWPDGEPSSDDNSQKLLQPVLHPRRQARIVRADWRQFRVYDGGLSHIGEDQ